MNLNYVVFIFALATSLFADDSKWKASGVVMFDQVYFNEKTAKGDEKNYPSGANLRVLDLSFEVPITPLWDLAIETDLTSQSGILDMAFLSYNGFEKTNLLIGQVPSPFCLERQESLKGLPFMERSLSTSTFAPCIGPGIAASQWFDQFTYRFSLTQAPYTKFKGKDNQGSDQWGGTLRMAYVPMHEQGHVLQFGGSLAYHDINESVDFSSGIEMKARETPKLVTTTNGGEKIKTDFFKLGSLEAAYECNQLQTSAEYFLVQVDQPDNKHLSLNGGYAQVNYFLTPHSRGYKFESNNFVGPKLKGEETAWQVGFRVSHIDLNDRNLRGGKETNHTLALNYYLNEKMKISTNYIRAFITTGHDEREKTLDILGMRWQTIF